MKYTATQYSIFSNKKCIATLFVGGTLKGNNELRIMQGMNRNETINKIIEDCPEFTKRYGLNNNYYPKLATEKYLKSITS